MNERSNPAAVGALFAQGLQLYRQGAIEQSENSLDQLLRLEPRHFDALHLQGLIAAQRGRPERAVQLIQDAVRQNPTVAAAHRHLGNAFRDLGRLEEALRSYGRAIELRRDFKEAYVNRALVLLLLHRPAEALADFDHAIILGADDAQLLTFRGSALIDLNRPAEAEADCERAIAKQPSFIDAHVNRAASLYLLERYDEAILSCDRALRLDETHGDAHAHRGAALYALRRLDEALASLERATALNPKGAFAHNLRALCLLDLQRPEQALESSDRAIALSPHLADAYNTRGLTLGDLQRFGAAMASFDQAIALQPGVTEPWFNKGIRYLQAGDFHRGWELCEWRPIANRPAPGSARAGTLWDGTQEIAGKTLHIYSEQGLGDTVQFCRYAKLLEARGAHVILAVQETLCTLLRGLGPHIEVIGSSQIPRDYDFHCPLLSLPRALGTRLDSIPADVPYLRPDPGRVSKWRERLGTEGRLIGIRWQGSTGRADAGRSFPVRHFERLARIPGVRLISLQKGVGVEQLLEPRDWQVEDLGSDFEPQSPDAFLDVAAVMELLELVISSDTSIAHLAGALARPTWLALKHVPDWRWMLDREDSPWYPTMRLFRQPRLGEWGSVFERMCGEILKERPLGAPQGAAPGHRGALVAMQPQNAEAWFLRGNALQLGGAHDEAVGSYERALRVRPDFPAALNNLGHSLRMLRRIQQALAIFARALALQPDYAMALNNQGLALLDLQRIPEALRSFDEALRVQPAFAEALSNRGTALLAAKRFAEAAETFERLVAVAPRLGGARGSLLYARRHCCDWRTYEPLAEGITAAVQRGEFADLPLSFMGVADSPHTHLACARTFSAARYPSPASMKDCVRHAHDKIRVAYLSGDFGEHAVSYLLAGVIARHDTRRFDTIAVGWGRQNDGPTRARLEAAFGRFIDATHVSDAEVAMQLRNLEIDIAIDLTGHTGGQRSGIFALRSAPLQVNYLGYPGTSGAPYMDYIIADSIVIPRGEERAYSECVARLPNCYLPNDDRRSVGQETLTRGAAGLPESGFVFCAFNNPVKITPAVFSVWMELLRQVPDSVLWLRAGVTEARRNLERAAEERGIAPSRLVFAAPVDSIESHLARHGLADLFLDTLPYNGHTTACDALWAGLPVLTCSGRSFASRVGESVLRAMALPELVTHSLPDYAQAALELARNPSRLGGIRERLAQNRRTSALFDTARYCRHLEAAYLQMWERQRAGLSPASFAVEADLA